MASMTIDFKVYSGKFFSRVFVQNDKENNVARIRSVTEENSMFEILESVWTITDKSDDESVSNTPS